MVVGLLVPLPINTRQLSGVHVPGGSLAGGQGDVGPQPRALQVSIAVSAANEANVLVGFGKSYAKLLLQQAAFTMHHQRAVCVNFVAYLPTHHPLDTERCPAQVVRTFHRIFCSIPRVVYGVPSTNCGDRTPTTSFLPRYPGPGKRFRRRKPRPRRPRRRRAACACSWGWSSKRSTTPR